MIEYSHCVETRPPYPLDNAWIIIEWCRNLFGYESVKSYPKPYISNNIPNNTINDFNWKYDVMCNDNDPSLNFYFKNEADYVLFTLTWI